MSKKYMIKFNDKNCIELSKPINTILVYRIPYKNIKNKNHNINISNRFIVYILFGKNEKGKDIIYVGKSKNRIDNRPTSHENKNDKWDTCYILTDIKERTILNDGTIQYLEDKICNRINVIDKYLNTTNQTTSGTANHSDMEDCDEYLAEAYDMLFALGLDLYEKDEDISKKSTTPRNYQISENLKPLYSEVNDLIKSINKDIKVEPMAVYLKYSLDNKIICTINSTNTELKMCFNIPVGKIIDSNNLLEDVSKKGHHGIGDYRYSFSDTKHFDDIKDFINQVINL